MLAEAETPSSIEENKQLTGMNYKSRKASQQIPAMQPLRYSTENSLKSNNSEKDTSIPEKIMIGVQQSRHINQKETT